VSAELFVVTELRRAAAGAQTDTNIAVRGIEPAGIAIRPELRLVEGRWFRPGMREVVAGASIARTMPELRTGATLRFRGAEWTVVGSFASAGDAHESELWTDVHAARDAFGGFGMSSLLVALESPGALATLKAAAAADPRLQLDAWPESGFFAAQSQEFSTNVRAVSTLVAGFMALGALFGALNSLYTAVATRQREIATLRAIGFSGTPVLCSVLAEAMLLALAGGALGAVLVQLLFDGMKVSTSNKVTQVAFDLSVTPDLILYGLAGALAIGFVGGLLPALRAARLPVAQALRASA
jgi:putative ABC transport system permease protein